MGGRTRHHIPEEFTARYVREYIAELESKGKQATTYATMRGQSNRYFRFGIKKDIYLRL